MQTVGRLPDRQEDQREEAADVQLGRRVRVQHSEAKDRPWTEGRGRSRIDVHPEVLPPVPSSIENVYWKAMCRNMYNSRLYADREHTWLHDVCQFWTVK